MNGTSSVTPLRTVAHNDIDTIGIDPHKASPTATAVNPITNTPVASLRIDASIAGYRHLLAWADKFPQRRWVVENTKGSAAT